MKLFLVDSGNSHLTEEVTKVTELGTKQQHGVLRVQPGTEEHGGPCLELAREGAKQYYIKFNVRYAYCKNSTRTFKTYFENYNL